MTFKGGGVERVQKPCESVFILWTEAGLVSYFCLFVELFAGMNNYTRMSHFTIGICLPMYFCQKFH